MTIHDTIAQIEELEKKATPGPWACRPMGGKHPILIGEHGMRPIVLAASRKGMHGATLTVRNQKLDIMQEISEDHPDIQTIVALRNAAPSLIAYIRALEKVRDSAKEAIQRERMDETYGADLSEIEYAVQDCDALAAGDRLLGRIDDVFDEKVTIQTAVNNGCSLSIDSNAYLIADMQPRLVEQLNRIESKLNDVAASREEAK